MSGDARAREELRELEAAAPGGLTSEDARRALAALRRGGLWLHQLLDGVPGELRSVGLVLGPPTTRERFRELFREWEALHGPLHLELARIRGEGSHGVAFETANTLVNREIATFGKKHGMNFADFLSRRGFLALDPDHFVPLDRDEPRP